MLTDHVPVGMSHLLGNPINRSHPRGQQLTGIGMPALTRPTITNSSRMQVSLEKPIPNNEVADMRQPALGVEEYTVQLVLADCLVVRIRSAATAPVTPVSKRGVPMPDIALPGFQCMGQALHGRFDFISGQGRVTQ